MLAGTPSAIRAIATKWLQLQCRVHRKRQSKHTLNSSCEAVVTGEYQDLEAAQAAGVY